MMPSVLPVKNEQAMDLAGIVSRMKQGIPPVDAQEYLWRVRLEAEGIPDVIVSDVNPRDFDQQQTPNMPCIPDFSEVKDKEFLLPSDEWKDMILADFAELRQLIAYWQEVGMSIHKRIEVPRMSDESGWIKFFFGKVNDDEETDNDSQLYGTPPLLRLIIQLDQVITRRLLEYQTEWLESEELSRARAVWIYALLARLDKPVYANVAATIRQLLRRCWELRGKIKDGKDTRLKPLNVIITLTGEFFSQLHEI